MLSRLPRRPLRRLPRTFRPPPSLSHPHALGTRHLATPAPSASSSAPDAHTAALLAQGDNAYYAHEMYVRWQADRASVHSAWDAYFSGMKEGGERAAAPGMGEMPDAAGAAEKMPLLGGMPSLHFSGGTAVEDHLKVQLLVRAYQVRGHHIADLDPLGINDPDLDDAVPAELTLEHYGWNEGDLDREITLGSSLLPRFATGGRTSMSIREVINTLKQIYCGSIGFQYVHMPSKEECDWIRERIELPKMWDYTTEEKRMILDRLIWSESFEKFIAAKYPNEKRFGLEGCEALVPGMKALVDRSVEHGVRDVVIGMPHRGRLNVLANVIRKPIEAILHEFSGDVAADDSAGGDVKYHLGANYVRPTPSGKKVSLSLVANPSHLESEDPIVLGKARALQHFNNDEHAHETAMGVLMHGDAAFAGQGVVYETMGFADLQHFSTGGTVHLIVNNQIGFTTDPRFARSTAYPSDIAKTIDAPIFHVNADDVEAVNFVAHLAADWRAKYKKDVVIDLVCYRRYGHNETDQPSFTQPRMYRAIERQPTALTQYTRTLIADKSFAEKDIEEHKKWVWGMLEKGEALSKTYKPSSREWLAAPWQGFPSPKELAEKELPERATGVDESVLKHIGKVISSFPDGFAAHRNLVRILSTRGKSIADGKGIDWPTAEALAFGTLALEKIHVRLTGQDVERGTFSQRHAVLHDQETEAQYVPLDNLGGDQAAFVVANSSLSEYGALGFELGYSLVSPDELSIWEAQFGDFANGAQVIIDQYLAAGERKWAQRSGLVMSLPHGFDGQGPEHSSARLERFLQLCDDNPSEFPTYEKMDRQHQDCNLQIVYPTTPANCFHVLRRQIHRDFRKPLILLWSKSLLRHPSARSTLDEFTGNTQFLRYIPEPHPESLVRPLDITKHILCSGQIYYQLVKEREDRGKWDVAISRVEQLSPFPYDLITPHLDKYPGAELLWLQEEPLNNGAWTYVAPRLRTAANQTTYLYGSVIRYGGRPPYSSVATGSKAVHKKEIENYLDQAFKTKAEYEAEEDRERDLQRKRDFAFLEHREEQ